MPFLSRNYLLFSIIFIVTPPLGAGLFIWAAYTLSVDTQAAVLSNIMLPTICAVFLAALIGWAVFLSPPKTLSDGKKAGLLTVFLCYLFAIIPLSIESGNWDGVLGVATVYFVIFVFGQIATFWVTYPIGMFLGRWIAARML